MKKIYSIGIAFMSVIILIIACQKQEKKSNLSLKKGFKNCFFIGTAMNVPQISGTDTSSLVVIKEHFNAVVAENCMKSEIIHPKENTFDFDLSDKFVAFGEANNMFTTGHTLIWHSQVAPWFFVNEKGNDVSKEVLIERMRNHIHTIVGRYKGLVRGWDVVNEAIMDDGSWRKSKFYTIIGEEFVKLAFQFAHEADPNAELYYNDYSMTKPGKRMSVVKLIEDLKASGIRIDAVGMQGHCSMQFPTIEEFEKSIKTFSETGVKVMITELDISVLPNPYKVQGADVSNRFEYRKEMDPYKKGLPEDKALALQTRYLNLFKVCLKHREKISRVTVWGVNDGQSWRNNWPIPGRTDFPLLFNRQNKAKPIVKDIIDEASNVK